MDGWMDGWMSGWTRIMAVLLLLLLLVSFYVCRYEFYTLFCKGSRANTFLCLCRSGGMSYISPPL